jgi:CBS domain-containing protein
MIRSEKLKSHQVNLIGRVQKAKDFEDLKKICRDATTIEMEFIEWGVTTIDIHFFISSTRDEITRKAIDLVVSDMIDEGWKKPYEKFAWVAVGSEGREEQTLFTDQDNALIYEDGEDAAAEEFYKEMAIRVVDKLEEVGFRKCRGKVMASEDGWRGRLSWWISRIDESFSEKKDLSRTLLFLTIILDSRHIAGEELLTQIVRKRLMEVVRQNFLTLSYMALDAGHKPVGINIFGKFVLEKRGTHKGKLNIKAVGCRPLVVNVRILAIAHGIEETNTIKRIWKLREKGVINSELAEDLEDAYNILTMTRILNHIKGLKKGYVPDDFLDPSEFSAEWQDKMKKALKTVRKMEAIVSTEFDWY